MRESTKHLEKIFKALGNERRIFMARYLKVGGEAHVGDVAREIGLSLRSTSRHLGILYRAGLLAREQRDKKVFYAIIPDPGVFVKHILDQL